MVAKYSYNKVGQAMLVRLLYNFVEAMTEASNFEAFVLGPVLPIPPLVRALLRDVAGTSEVFVSTRCTTPRGGLSASDVVEYLNPPVLGRVQLLMKSWARGGQDRF